MLKIEGLEEAEQRAEDLRDYLQNIVKNQEAIAKNSSSSLPDSIKMDKTINSLKWAVGFADDVVDELNRIRLGDV